MRIFTRRPKEDVETEHARLIARADARGHEQMVERIQRSAERKERLEEERLKRAEDAEERKKKRTERAETRAAMAKAIREHGEVLGRQLVLVLPLLFINGFAAFGQAGYAGDHFGWSVNGFGWGLIAAVAFAATLESIAVYIGYHAHAALMAGDSAMKLQLASYVMGAVVGGINYDHYAGPDFAPTAMGVVFGLLSLISPWLWAMHGRYKNRKRLRELGLIDEKSPHFSAAKWLHFPWQTMGALRYGIAHNLKDPSAAWDGYQEQRHATKAARKAERERKQREKDGRPAVRVTVVRVTDYTVAQPKTTLRLYRVDALATTYDHPTATTERPAVATTPVAAIPETASTGHVHNGDRPDASSVHRDHQVDATTTASTGRARTRPQQKTTRKTGRDQVDATSKAQPTAEDNQQAVDAYLESVKAGKPLSKRALAKQFGFSPSWALKRIQEAGPRPVGGGHHVDDHLDATTPKDQPVTSEVKTG